MYRITPALLIVLDADTPPQGSPAVGDASSPEKETNPTLAHNVISEWTVDAVCEWLSSIGLEEYCGGFRDNQIDGEELQNLTSDTLSRDLGVSTYR